MTVAADFVAVGNDRRREIRRALKANGGGSDRCLDVMRTKQSENARGAGLDAVAVVAFVAEIAKGFFQSDAQLVHGLRATVAVLDRHFRTFLDIDDEG